MRRKHPHESRLEQLQHDDDDDDAARFEYDDRLFREDLFFGGGS